MKIEKTFLSILATLLWLGLSSQPVGRRPFIRNMEAKPGEVEIQPEGRRPKAPRSPWKLRKAGSEAHRRER